MGLPDHWRNIRFSFLLFSFILLLPSSSFSVSAPPSPPVVTYGQNWERSCSDALCTLTLYSAPTFYAVNGNWLPITESFSQDNCDPGYDYCTPSQLLRIQVSANGNVLLSKSNSTSMRLLSVNNQSVNWPAPSQVNNQLTWSFPQFALTYTSLPTRLKEEITLFSNPGISLKFNYSISLSPDFVIGSVYLEDAAGRVFPLSSALTNDTVSFSLNQSFLSSLVYPVVVDPSISLNDSFTLWNGYVSNATGISFSRTDNPTTTLRIGRFKSSGVSQSFRSAMYFNISSLPVNAIVQNVLLEASVVQQLGDDSNLGIRISALEGTNDTYPNAVTVCDGNCLWFLDMGNGSLYNQTSLPQSGRFVINLSSAVANVSQPLLQDWFGIGFSSSNEADNGSEKNDSRLRPRDFSTASQRPVLNITYRLTATEDEGRTAIEQGINDSLGAPGKSTGQQIYIATSDLQKTGRVDKATSLGNQYWLFNFLTFGETTLWFPSLPIILNVWENSSLNAQEIRLQVGGFINQTKAGP